MNQKKPYLITVLIDPSDPRRTKDELVSHESAYQAGWLFRHLNPGVRILGIRPAPEHR